MKENKENIKMLTKEDVISLSNDKKRQAFIADYQKWGVWLEIPELQINVYKVVFPEGEVAFVSEFGVGGENVRRAYRYAGVHGFYDSYPEYLSIITEKIKDLKVKYCRERQKRR